MAKLRYLTRTNRVRAERKAEQEARHRNAMDEMAAKLFTRTHYIDTYRQQYDRMTMELQSVRAVNAEYKRNVEQLQAATEARALEVVRDTRFELLALKNTLSDLMYPVPAKSECPPPQ